MLKDTSYGWGKDVSLLRRVKSTGALLASKYTVNISMYWPFWLENPRANIEAPSSQWADI